MTHRHFNLIVFCTFCAVLIIIPFWAMYFEVSGVKGRPIEWLQVFSGFFALTIGGVTLFFVRVQLKKADQQLTKANEQLVKADIQIELANKQLKLADTQLDLARKDSAVLTLQLRANACATIEADLLLIDQVLRRFNGVEMKAIQNAFSQMTNDYSAVSYGGQVRRQAQNLLPDLDKLETSLSKNVEGIIAHLSDTTRKQRELFSTSFSEYVVYVRGCTSNSGRKLDQSILDSVETNATNYLNELQTADRTYKSLLDEAKMLVESE
ncbi:hypothetical protein PsAD13_04973 [Pseudovibrio sp. Ad13]|uniref:hypothetical protein n=1 Tax=Pseudovibrio sp. Ad13 TaxID=989396 RepID=UPI0007AE4C2D|nr:hypothetical protein [Pseudovibrio sp. Ad13]KZK79982.1 hypothetical protein PsAD13_04973 [Pseudovibrio sp. Ad13]